MKKSWWPFFSIVIILVAVIAGALISKLSARESFLVDDASVTSLNIPTPAGWWGVSDFTPGNTRPRDSWTDMNHVQLYDFTKIETSSATNAAFGGQIIVEAQKMDRPLVPWVQAYIYNNTSLDYAAFDPLQNWSILNGHLLISAEEKPDFSFTYYLFNDNTVYTFWFNPFARPAPGGQTYVYNTDGMKTVQAMITSVAAKL